jgi:hypothetical protein
MKNEQTEAPHHEDIWRTAGKLNLAYRWPSTDSIFFKYLFLQMH